MIPIGTSYRLKNTPWVNYALVIANVVIFVLGYHSETIQGYNRIRPYLLYPDTPQLTQFFTSVFLHGSVMHLVGNMVFLWVFGNPINDRFGNLGYLAFYLAGGVLAGIGYILLSGNAPVLGASGAISAVTGAFLVFFPRTRVTVLFWFYIIMPFELSSLFFLMFQFLFGLFMSVQTSLAPGGVRVAHWAHSSGYVFGIGISAILLAVRVLPRDPFDLLNLVRMRHRRGKYQRMVARGHDPFNYVDPALRRERSVEARTVQTATPDTPAGRELKLRRQIAEVCSRGDLHAATENYLQLVQISEDAVLSRQNQLDVANQLMSDERYPAAADAYERFLKHYGNYEYAADIYLMLGIVYGRYLQQYDRAEQFLQRAVQGLHDERKLQLAQKDLQHVRSRRGQ